MAGRSVVARGRYGGREVRMSGTWEYTFGSVVLEGINRVVVRLLAVPTLSLGPSNRILSYDGSRGRVEELRLFK